MDETQEQFAAEAGYGAMATEPQEIKKTKEQKKEELELLNREALAIALRDYELYFDGERYWSELEDGRWVSDIAGNAASNIRQKFSLYKPDYIEQVLYRARMDRRIDGVFPYIHNKQKVMKEDGGTFLNISCRQLVEPSNEDGVFPWIRDYLDHAFDPSAPEQLDIFLAWFQRLYVSALQGRIQAGQALVFAGPIGTGKTLCSRRIIGGALGGFTDAAEYLLGKTSFNKEAAEVAIWSIDDNRGGATWEKHDELSNAIKRTAANPQIPYHPKFRDATMVSWRGRIVVTCNLDEKSLSILPELDSSIQDKMIWLKGSDYRPNFKDVEQVIKQELPYFLRWLTQWQPPASVINGDERFKVRPYYHPDLIASARAASADYQLIEMLQIAVEKSIINDKKEKERWFTSAQIRAALDIEGVRGSLAKFGGNRLGIALSKLASEPDTKNLVKAMRWYKGTRQFLLTLEPENWGLGKKG